MVKKIATFTLVLAVLALGSTAHAIPITGSIGFLGAMQVFGPDPDDLDGATGVSFGASFATARDGSYAAVPLFTPITFSSIVSFAGFVGLAPLWTFMDAGLTYSFDMTTLAVTQPGDGTITLKGTGIAKITGFDDTPGSFILTSQEPRTGTPPKFTWSGVAPVPEPTTLGLLGLGFLGLGLLRRKAD